MMKNKKGAVRCLAPFVLSWIFFISPASAASYDLKQITPEVQQAIQARQSRYAPLQSLRQSGAVGENNQGFVALLGQAPGAEELISAENRDRDMIYQAIASQNGLGPDGLSEVRRIFAEVQRGKALPGERIELPTGEWIKK